MIVKTKATQLHSHSTVEPVTERFAEFEAPEGAENVSGSILLIDGRAWLIVTWLELTRSERTELMLARARQNTGQIR